MLTKLPNIPKNSLFTYLPKIAQFYHIFFTLKTRVLANFDYSKPSFCIGVRTIVVHGNSTFWALLCDYRPFIIADADTGHGGDAHVRNLIRRFVEVGVPGYHIEDQKPGVKKCGHQGGKVLVPVDEHIKRLSAARFQLDIMQVPGIIVSRTDAESATLLDGRGDERDQPFILGATNVNLPTFKVGFLAILRRFHRGGIEELSGHALYATSDEEYAIADAWIDRAGLGALLDGGARRVRHERKRGGRRGSRQGLRPFRRRLAGRGRREDVRRGRRGRHVLPRRRGRARSP